MAELSLGVWGGLIALSFLAAPLVLLGIGRVFGLFRAPDVTAQQLPDLHDRAQMFEASLAAAPVPIWITSDNADTVWQNQVGHDLRNEFPDAFGGADGTRVSLPAADGRGPRWFEVTCTEIGARKVYFAPEITAEMRAENARRNFLQTLTKTFANLTTGLVVFDRSRQLALFNPALLDHTGLTAEFLSARPSLMSFFDQLRNRQVMPEPKSYASWRAQISEVVETASGGLYQETWSLPGGTVFRVSGRPHPDGAVAFLFEDISADISLTRGFRAQLDMLQHAMDAMDTAIAILGANDTVGFCNRACRDFLQVDPDAVFAAMSARDLIRICEEKLPAEGFWKQAHPGECGSLGDSLRKSLSSTGGGQVNCQITPVSPGMTMMCLHLPGTRQMPPPSQPTASGALAS